jgi:hypothetical protein
MQHHKGIAEMLEEDWNILRDRHMKEIQANADALRPACPP